VHLRQQPNAGAMGLVCIALAYKKHIALAERGARRGLPIHELSKCSIWAAPARVSHREALEISA